MAMADSDFEVDVENLRRGANRYLGAAIDDMSTAKAEFDKARGHVYAFEGGDDLFSEVRTRWEEMQHYFDRVFDDNIENLTLAQEALLEIASRYEEADNASAESLRGIQT
jgi:hypothetical protein